MTKNNIMLIVAALILASVYVIYFTDWFKPKTVQIFHTSRNLHPRMVRGAAMLPNLVFGINQQLRLTELRVVPADVYKTNANATPVWHLISESNSIPIKQFHYGQFIPGMHPKIKGLRPQVLETNVTYHLILQAGSVKGEHDFSVP
jgi:hypothetical protein